MVTQGTTVLLTEDARSIYTAHSGLMYSQGTVLVQNNGVKIIHVISVVHLPKGNPAILDIFFSQQFEDGGKFVTEVMNSLIAL